ncbi:MAG: putative addiction module antidote protein [Nitrospirae bacterium]|nr:putative addiction module antidote protein [Nitrospirota bacterium]
MPKKSTTYQEDLIHALKDAREAAAYLSAAIEDGDREVFLLALRNVAEAQGGMTALARRTHMNRESLYRMLSSRGNPEIRSVLALLSSMKLKVTIEPQKKRAKSGRKKSVASAHAA